MLSTCPSFTVRAGIKIFGLKQEDFLFPFPPHSDLCCYRMISGTLLGPVISSNCPDCSSLKLTLQPNTTANLSISLLTQGQRKMIIFTVIIEEKKGRKGEGKKGKERERERNSNRLRITEIVYC